MSNENQNAKQLGAVSELNISTGPERVCLDCHGVNSTIPHMPRGWCAIVCATCKGSGVISIQNNGMDNGEQIACDFNNQRKIKYD